MTMRGGLVLLAISAWFGASPALAADASPVVVAPGRGAIERPWTPVATTLAAHGVTFGGSMTGLWIGDVAGGMKTGGVYNTLGFASVDADLEKLAKGWHGARAFANVAWIRGGSVSWSYVGDALAVSNLDGFDSIRLYDAWLQQSFGDVLSIRAGSLSADEEFGGTECGAMLTNSAFGWNAGISANVPNGGPIFYAPGLGVRLAATPRAGWTARVGAYDGDTFDSADGRASVNAHGVHFALDRAQGAFVVGELVHAWGPESGGAPGAITLGGWRHTASVADARLDVDDVPFAASGLEPAIHPGIEGAYGVLEQRLWNATPYGARHVAAWTRLAFAPANRSALSFVGEAGVRWNGPFASRADDALALGVVHAAVSSEVRAQVRDANALDHSDRVVPDYERVVELAYAIAVRPHWTLTPDVQWVQHPGTTRQIRDALVTGLRLSFE